MDRDNMKMDCSSVKLLLSSYIDNDLDDKQSKTVTAHISKCSSCKCELGNMYKMRDMIKSVYSPKGEVDFSAGIMARIKAEPARNKKTEKTRGKRMSLAGKFIYAGAAAAAALIAIGATISYFQYGGSQTLVQQDNKFEEYTLEHYVNSYGSAQSHQTSVLSVNFEQ